MFKFDNNIIIHLQNKKVPTRYLSELSVYQMETKGNFYYDKSNVNTVINYSRLLLTRAELESKEEFIKSSIFDNAELFETARLIYYKMRSVKNILDDFLENNKSYKISNYQVIEYNIQESDKNEVLNVFVDNANQNVVYKQLVSEVVEYDHPIKEFYIFNNYKNVNGIKSLTLTFSLASPTQFSKFVCSIFSHGVNLTNVRFKVNGIFVPDIEPSPRIDTYKDTFVISIPIGNKPLVASDIVIDIDILFSDKNGDKIEYYLGIGKAYVVNEKAYTNTTGFIYALQDRTKLAKLLIGENNYKTRGEYDNEVVFLTNIDNYGVNLVRGQIVIKSLIPYTIELFPKPKPNSSIKITTEFLDLIINESDLIRNRLLYISPELYRNLQLNIGDAVLLEYEPIESSLQSMFKRSDILVSDILECDDDKLALIIREFEDDTLDETDTGINWNNKDILINMKVGNYYREVETRVLKDGSLLSFLSNGAADPIYYGVLKIIESEDLYWYVEQKFGRGMIDDSNSMTVTLRYEYLAGTIIPYMLIDQYYIRLEFEDAINNINFGPDAINPSNTGNKTIYIKNIPEQNGDIVVIYQPAMLESGYDIISNLQPIFGANIEIAFQKGLCNIERNKCEIDTVIIESWMAKDGMYTHPIAQTVVYRPFKVTNLNGETLRIGDISYNDKTVAIKLAEETDETCVVFYHASNTDIVFNITPKQLILDDNFAVVIE